MAVGLRLSVKLCIPLHMNARVACWSINQRIQYKVSCQTVSLTHLSKLVIGLLISALFSHSHHIVLLFLHFVSQSIVPLSLLVWTCQSDISIFHSALVLWYSLPSHLRPSVHHSTSSSPAPGFCISDPSTSVLLNKLESHLSRMSFPP